MCSLYVLVITTGEESSLSCQNLGSIFKSLKLKESRVVNKRRLEIWLPAGNHWPSPSWKTTTGDPAAAVNHLYGATGTHPSL